MLPYRQEIWYLYIPTNSLPGKQLKIHKEINLTVVVGLRFMIGNPFLKRKGSLIHIQLTCNDNLGGDN